MDEFCIPKSPVPPQAQIDEVKIYLDMIAYFEGLQRPSISPMELISMAFQSPSGSNNIDDSYNSYSYSYQQLKIFQDLILDVMISYVIFKAQVFLDEVSPNHAEQSKCVKKRKAPFSTNQLSSIIIHPVPQVVAFTAENEFQVETAQIKLVEYFSHHDFLSFVYYLILGVKGLFTAQKDHPSFSISSSMFILYSFHLIYQNCKPPPPKKPFGEISIFSS
ncbi:hypothetical protein O181_000096 [Austropuccinia psidii MF-1]|uniref:Uncharacterized protein n=1 Tax=Austropuccinia psidii MF-1 TaxID=1389203 RepID=A0A9Q3B7X8_9BASI|nr:hypothetical protein [Austropuccinia psidii MF-1]